MLVAIEAEESLDELEELAETAPEPGRCAASAEAPRSPIRVVSSARARRRS